MQKKLGIRFVNILKREAAHENEPQRILFLLRIILMVLCVYYMIFPIVMHLVAPGSLGWLGLIFEILGLGTLHLTYKVRVRTSVFLCVTLQLAWVICHLILYGWNCGIQHLMFSMIVLVYFSTYNAVFYKVLFTILLFGIRFGLFMYCRICTDVYSLSESATVTLQILSTVLTFVLMGITCGMFSSNVESAEKKLVLYNESLKRQAATDPLTGLWNRRQMMQYVTELREKEPELPFSLGMSDIDFFKKINDNWGHDCGDAVLVWITEHMRKALSGRGKLCRWGGEEFIFFFPNMNGDQVCEALNELRANIDNDPFDWKGEWIPVTMTFGVEENDFSSSIDTLLKNVDDKLYMGKAQGRDRVVY